MGALVQLSATGVEVEPGHSTTLAVTVRNTGTVVDRFSFEAIGAAPSWFRFEPETLSLFPEATGTIAVVVAPPRESNVAAGPVPFAVKISSSEDPQNPVVEEATLVIGAFSDVAVELVPRVSRGRRSARTRIALDNRSNCPYRAEVAGTDPAGALAMKFNPAVVDVPPGGAEFVKLAIRPRAAFWRGASTNKPFRVTFTSMAMAVPVLAPASSPEATAVPSTVEPSPAGDEAGTIDATGGTGAAAGRVEPITAETPVVGPETPSEPADTYNPHPPAVVADGSMMQDPLLPSWFAKALIALLALIAVLVVLWLTLLRPEIRNTAQNEVKKQLAADGVTPAAASSGSSPAKSAAGGSTSPTSIGSTSAKAPSASSSSVVVNGSTQASGNGTTTVYTVPSGQVLEVTDLLVENSAGDTGTIAVGRNGTVLMEWSMANFRDLDYHWIAPTLFASGSQMQIIVSGCSNACTPGIYYAGNLVKTS